MIEFSTRMLSNGMRLLHHFDPMTRMVAIDLMYCVGSRDERPGKTGLAHLMEHLMFSGSSHVENFDKQLQQAGGESNAWTSVDVTNFYDVLPAQNIETALWLESDRLVNLRLDENRVDVQRSVVIQEFMQRCLNVPYGDLNHLIHEQAFNTHPYRWPTIGACVSDIENLSLSDIKDFYHNYYSPQNLIMCIAGNVPFEEAWHLTEKWFGDIEPSTLLTRSYPVEGPQREQRTMTVGRDVPQDVVTLSFHMCGRTHADFAVCDMISDLLANGRSARFTQNIMAKSNVFAELDAAVEGTFDPGLFLIRGKLSKNGNMWQAQELIEEELHRMMTVCVESDEILKCVNKYQSTSLFENLSYLQKATKLCLAQAHGDVKRVNSELEQYRSVTSHDILRVSSQLFVPDNASIVYYNSNI